MKIVKGDKALKALWSAGRRAITPKVGQLTNDRTAIMRIVSEPKPFFHALLTV